MIEYRRRESAGLQKVHFELNYAEIPPRTGHWWHWCVVPPVVPMTHEQETFKRVTDILKDGRRRE